LSGGQAVLCLSSVGIACDVPVADEYWPGDEEVADEIQQHCLGQTKKIGR
jgi:hypothetical protein